MFRKLTLLAAQAAAADVLMQNADRFTELAQEHGGFATQRFKTSDIVAPIFNVNHWDRNLTDDLPYLFIGANYNKNGAGPMIYDAADLSLVYADQSWSNSYHSEMQTVHGKPHFTFFANTHEGEHPGMRCNVVDETYQIKHEVRAVHPHRSDMHELHVTDEGTAIFTTNFKIPFDCSRWGGAEDGHVVGYGFQEVDLETNEVLFDWKANDHDDPDDSYARFEPSSFGLNEHSEGSFDLYHYNSVRKESGNYLVSSRNYCHIKLINGTSGDDIWVLGGKQNQFADLSAGRATDFCWQHNARFIDGDHTRLTLFDNHSLNQGDCDDDDEAMDDCVTRGLQLELNFDYMTARVAHEYYHPGHVNSGAMGGMQKLDSGNAIVGWGWTPSITEFTDDGRVAMDIQRGIVGVARQNNMFAYRVFKSHWKGLPTWKPSVAFTRGGWFRPEATFYASWNGATEVRKWAVFTSDKSDDVTSGDAIATANRTGFETSTKVDQASLRRYVVVGALDKDGEVIGTSEVYDVSGAAGASGASDASVAAMPEFEYEGPNRAGIALAVLGSVTLAASLVFALRCWYRRRQARQDGARYIPVKTEEQP